MNNTIIEIAQAIAIEVNPPMKMLSINNENLNTTDNIMAMIKNFNTNLITFMFILFMG
jgi:hypothetical protein